MGMYLGNQPVRVIKRSDNQLIPFPYHSKFKTINGVTFTVNDDGTLVCNGTATAWLGFYFVNGTPIKLKSGIPYHLSGCTGGSRSTFFLEARANGSSGVAYVTDLGDGKTAQFTDSYIDQVYAVIQSGTKLDNVVFAPMLNEGETAKPYETYNQYYRIRTGIRAKNPKNLFDPTKYTMLKDGSKTVCGFDISKLEFGKIYTFSVSPSIFRFKISNSTTGYSSPQFVDYSNNLKAGTWTHERNANIPSTDTLYLFVTAKYGDTEPIDAVTVQDYQIMINEGETAEPYLIVD